MLIFVNLGKFRKKPDKDTAGDTNKIVEDYKGGGKRAELVLDIRTL